MMESRPATRHRAARHGPECSRFGRTAEIDMPDHAEHETDECNVMDENADLAQQDGETQRKPHRNPRQQKSNRAETDRPEEKDLAAVVLPAFLDVLPSHVSERLSTEPSLLVLVQMHVRQPVKKLHGRCDEEQHAYIWMDHTRRFETADERGHPSEDWCPDRHAADRCDDERQRDRPMDQARCQAMANDLIARDDVVATARDDGDL